MVILICVHNIIWDKEVRNNTFVVQIIPKEIPNVEKKLLCSVFLDAVIRFYKDPENEKNFKIWCTKKGENAHEQNDS